MKVKTATGRMMVHDPSAMPGPDTSRFDDPYIQSIFKIIVANHKAHPDSADIIWDLIGEYYDGSILREGIGSLSALRLRMTTFKIPRERLPEFRAKLLELVEGISGDPEFIARVRTYCLDVEETTEADNFEQQQMIVQMSGRMYRGKERIE